MKYTCIFAYRAECCDQTHIHDRCVSATTTTDAATRAVRALVADIPSAVIASDEIVVIPGEHELMGVMTAEVTP